jgi:adenine-specific DNA-methyltransferase
MVFLYFLQKKGWFGVDAKEEWGTGPKNFIRELFRRREKYGENFFNDVLEPLFYEALAQDRGQDSIYPRLNNCRMPFLNGGLFEPMRGYSWEITDILLPDKLFSNENKTKEGDTGDGILDVFDRYNFTVNESDPLEKEVAVDPEMLGKVFENLLDVKDRKSSGSYYTPREIVHYMCQECLINYLETETKGDIPREDIEYVVLNGETIIQNDLVTLEKQREKEEKGYKYTGTYELKLPESIRKNARRIDELLKEIKVCDPAVGSGAFPLGMINEITGVRQVLQVYLRDGLLNYDLKYHAIANSIHGVDLDPGAVEIARLRLWLSLVVEEKNPRPLPNLEHRVMQGNSLLSEYEGIQLFNKDLLAGGDDDEAVQFEMIYDSGIKGKIEELERNIKLYVDTSQRSQKQRIKENIDELRWELIEDTLKEQGKLDKVEEVKSLRDRNVRPFFIWELEFSEVFKEKGGFDVVIGNPPYVGEKGHKEIFRELKKGNMGKYYQGKMDLFYFFFHLALNLGNHTSKIAFITTNYYVTASGGKKLRTDLKKRSIVERLINFNELKIFETARGQHNMITILCKGHDPEQIANTCITERTGNANSEILNKIISWTDPKTKYYKIKQKDLYTGSQNYIRFESLNGGNNLLGSALNKMQSQGTLLGEICNVNQGIVTGADKVSNRHLKKYNWKEEKGTGIFVLNDEEVETLNTKKYFKKWFKNSDIRKYYTNVDTSENILYLNDNFEGEQDILSHLSRFKENLLERREVHSGSRKWHDLWRGRDPEIFESPKIVAPQRSNTNTFGYSENAWYASADVYFITSKPNTKVRLKYILALLNSKLFYQWLYHKGKRKGETLELYQTPLSEIPIKIIEEKEQQLFITMVDKILDLTSGENYDPHNPPEIQKELEEQIDQMVYKLYGLTKEEIEDVEETIPS